MVSSSVPVLLLLVRPPPLPSFALVLADIVPHTLDLAGLVSPALVLAGMVCPALDLAGMV